MKRLLLLVFTIALLPIGMQAGFFDFFSKSTPSTPPAIKVLVTHDQPGAVIEVKGKYKLFDPKTNEHLSTRFIGKRKYMHALKDGLQWGEEFPGLHQLQIIPDSEETTTLVDGIEYKGAIMIYDIGGSISVVNAIDIEDYLKSTLSETKTLPEELMAVLAITARTNASYLAANPKTTFWAINGKQVGYKGYAVTNRNSSMEAAIESTRAMILSLGEKGKNKINPFLIEWNSATKAADQKAVVAQISLGDAEALARRGENAGQILAKAFPNSILVLTHSNHKRAHK